jgi:hypothetical protein
MLAKKVFRELPGKRSPGCPGGFKVRRPKRYKNRFSGIERFADQGHERNLSTQRVRRPRGVRRKTFVVYQSGITSVSSETAHPHVPTILTLRPRSSGGASVWLQATPEDLERFRTGSSYRFSPGMSVNGGDGPSQGFGRKRRKSLHPASGRPLSSVLRQGNIAVATALHYVT